MTMTRVVRRWPAGTPVLILLSTILLSAAGWAAASSWETHAVQAQSAPQQASEQKGFGPNLGNYFDVANPGWGLDIQRAGDLVFIVWFTYNPDGTPTWYVIVGELDGMSLTGNIESFKWDPFGDPGDQAMATVVGTMTIAWSDPSTAEVSWTLDGVAGSASVAFFLFSDDPAFANLTGHYFSFFGPGWGFTLLTQGSVTAMTMYWYKDGQPVWAQGVSAELGTAQLIELLYFSGPGLCPSCLPRAAQEKGYTTTSLATVQANWFVALPPQVTLDWVERPDKGGPLGERPFSDIPLDESPLTTEAFTSAFQTWFDPTYDKLAQKGGAGGCIPFLYDPGFWEVPPEITGGFQNAYAGLPPTAEGRIPVYTNAACTNPFTIELVGTMSPTSVILGATDEDGTGGAFDWSAYFGELPPAKGNGDCDDDGICFGAGGGAVRADDPEDKHAARGIKGAPSAVRVYGGNPFVSQRVGDAVAREAGPWDLPPSLDAIEQTPDQNAYIIVPND